MERRSFFGRLAAAVGLTVAAPTLAKEVLTPAQGKSKIIPGEYKSPDHPIILHAHRGRDRVKVIISQPAYLQVNDIVVTSEGGMGIVIAKGEFNIYPTPNDVLNHYHQTGMLLWNRSKPSPLEFIILPLHDISFKKLVPPAVRTQKGLYEKRSEFFNGFVAGAHIKTQYSAYKETSAAQEGEYSYHETNVQWRENNPSRS